MSTANREKEAQPYHQRVVVRLRDHVEMGFTEMSKRIEDRKILPLGRLRERFPEMRVGPVFDSVSPETLKKLIERAQALDPTYRPPNFASFVALDVAVDGDAEALLAEVSKGRLVEEAYLDPGPTPPPVVNAADDPRAASQGYLAAAPAGIDARFAWTLPGGDGAGVGVVDMERGWTLSHEDLAAAGIALISGNSQDFFGHGTSVLGELRAVDNTLGDVGIVPAATVRVVSQWRTSTNYNTESAILSAIATMSPGDVLLLEAQTSIGSLSNMPVEVYSPAFEAIRLATALGITVVEATGNGGNDLDAYTDGTGARTLDRSSTAFKDSGAVMVGAASSAAPHARLSFSNFGSRIDCYAWGQGIDTTGDGWTGNLTTSYTSSFGGTSGASPIITGAAAALQGIARASLGHPFEPGRLRQILKDPASGTASANPAVDRIGVMPDLKAILQGNILGLAQDVYLRDYVGDNGDPHSGAVSASPDIIVRTAAVPNPQLAFGQGSGTEMSNTLSDDVEHGSDNHVYVRALNRGGSPATGVRATVYWSPAATLVTPNLWTLIGTVTLPTVPAGNVLTASNEILWPAAGVPATGHYCFVGLIGTDADPAPALTDLLDWDTFVRFIRANNNVTWRNFNVVNNVPPSEGAPPGFVDLPFLVPGAPDKDRPMVLEVVGRLPARSKVYFEAPIALLRRLDVRVQPDMIDKKGRTGRVAVRPCGRQALGKVVLPAKSRFACRLHVHIDPADRKHPYEIAVRQLFEGVEVGRVTFRLAPPRKKG